MFVLLRIHIRHLRNRTQRNHIVFRSKKCAHLCSSLYVSQANFLRVAVAQSVQLLALGWTSYGHEFSVHIIQTSLVPVQPPIQWVPGGGAVLFLRGEAT
jgi:hypothetical protein